MNAKDTKIIAQATELIDGFNAQAGGRFGLSRRGATASVKSKTPVARSTTASNSLVSRPRASHKPFSTSPPRTPPLRSSPSRTR